MNRSICGHWLAACRFSPVWISSENWSTFFLFRLDYVKSVMCERASTLATFNGNDVFCHYILRCCFSFSPLKYAHIIQVKEIDREQMTVESRKVTLASWSLCRCEQRAAIHSIHIYSWEYWITFATSVQLLVQVCTSRRWLHDTGFSNPYILPLMHLIRSAIRVFQQKRKKQKKRMLHLCLLYRVQYV